MKSESEYINLTDRQYKSLERFLGEKELTIRMKRLINLKKANKRPVQMKSDFQALSAMGARPVAPIKNKEKIEKMKKVLAASSQRNYFLFILGLNSGLRVSELLELRVKDVRGKRSVERLERKTGKVKYFPLNKETRENINNYISGMLDTDFLFTSRKTGKPLHRDRAYKILKEAAEEAGISEFGTHTLRKTFGYHFYLKHEDAAILQKLFNHSSVSVTLKYIGISQEEIEAGLEDFSL